jgi:maleamate amidohydrolase
MARIWDKYLTEDEQEWISARKRPPFDLSDRRIALIMVDIYRGGFGDKPDPLLEAVKTWPWSCGENGWKALPHIVELLDTCRSCDIPVVHITMRDPSDGLVGWIEARNRPSPSDRVTSPVSDQMRRATRIIDEVAPKPGEPIIEKSAPSGFWGTPLIGHLQYLQVDTILVAGMATAGCIRSTVMDAVSHRLRIVIPEECVFDRIEASHAMTLFDLHYRCADVMPADEVLAAVRSRKHGASAHEEA